MANEDIRCPYCATSLSPALSTCPSCGNVIPGADTSVEPIEKQAPAPEQLEAPVERQAAPVEQQAAPPPSPPPSPPLDEIKEEQTPAKKSKVGPIIGIFVMLSITIVGVVLGSSDCSWFRPQAPDNRPLPLYFNEPVTGTIDRANPHWLYELVVTKRGLVHIEVTGDFDTFLQLYRPGSDTPFHEDDDSANGNNARLVDVLEPGTYYVVVAYSSWSTGTYRLTAVSMDEPIPLSQAEKGFPWPPSTRRDLHRHFHGVAGPVTGRVNVVQGNRCDVFVGQAEPGDYNCRVVVYCGNQLLYGRATNTRRLGYIDCRLVQSGGELADIHARDAESTGANGDPIMELDTSARRVRVAEHDRHGNWEVPIRLLSDEERARLDAPDAGTP